MASNVVRSNNFFRHYFMKKKQEGVTAQKALFAVTHKLIRNACLFINQVIIERSKPSGENQL
jgi:hypothetical protein